jgi:tetratricopeptide (TPR) repeat protein
MEDILTQLARVPGLQVRSRTSVMRYRNTTSSVPEIAEVLGVDYVLEGSVRRDDDVVRVAAQLIEARTDRHVWAATYDRRLTDLFLVQSEISRDIARALGARVTTRTADAGSSRVDPNAYEQFLLGRERFHTRTSETLEEAIALFRNALTYDSTFALAHAYLASAYVRSVMPENTRVGQRAWLDSAQAHARHAIHIAPQQPDGYAALGAAFNALGRRGDAIEQHERALEADPNYALAMFELARVHGIEARIDDAMVWLERAIAIDPARADYRGFATTFYRSMEVPEQGRLHLEAGLRLNPADVSLHWEGVQLFFRWGMASSVRPMYCKAEPNPCRILARPPV